MLGVPQVAAGTGVHGGHQHEAGGIGDGGERPGDGDPAILQRLTQDFQDVFLELLLGNFNITCQKFQYCGEKGLPSRIFGEWTVG